MYYLPIESLCSRALSAVPGSLLQGVSTLIASGQSVRVRIGRWTFALKEINGRKSGDGLQVAWPRRAERFLVVLLVQKIENHPQRR